jgi:hypothetical protein
MTVHTPSATYLPENKATDLVIYREATALGVSDRTVQSSEKGFPPPWLHSQSSSFSCYY